MIWLLLAGPAWAQLEASLYKGRVQFVPPPGLRSLSPDSIKEDYTGRVPPQYVYKNSTGDVAIAFNHLQKPVTQATLTAFRDRLEADLKQKMEVVEWVDTSFQTIHGVRWFQLEFKTMTEGYTIHNTVLGTPVDGRLLEVSFNTFADFDPIMDAELLESRRSLRLVSPKSANPGRRR